MDKNNYKKIVDKNTPKANRLANGLIAFLVGGLVGFLGELFVEILINSYSFERQTAAIWLCITLIFLGSFSTALNFFDDVIQKVKMGLILPTTGFSHSITSSALDYKKDGVISLGSNFFKLAGSVILYGVVSAYIFGTIRYLFFGG